MKIITLGTGHGDPTYCRFNSSTLYESPTGDLYLLDCGAPADALMVRVNKDISRVKAVFNTHVHADHFGGLPVMLKSYVKACGKKNRECALTVFCAEERVIQPVKDLYTAMYAQRSYEFDSCITMDTVHEGKLYEDENISVRAVATKHMNYCGGTSYSFVLTEKQSGKVLLYTGDLDAEFSDFPLGIKADVCICEATHYKQESAGKVLPECDFKRFIFNHVHDTWHGDEGEKLLLSLNSHLPYPVNVAHDMEEFEI
ncbi:MAG: ribonuclease Z [Ruminococcaceae bacterium]|nr:ribonuclease Z [Oscillospiraceae bacterium]